MDDISEKCIFVRYNEESKEYRFYNPITNKYVVSRGVVLKEEEASDGTIDIPVAEGVVSPHTEDEGDEKGVQGG